MALRRGFLFWFFKVRGTINMKELRVGDRVRLVPERFATNGDVHIFRKETGGRVVGFLVGRFCRCPIVVMRKDQKGAKYIRVFVPEKLLRRR